MTGSRPRQFLRAELLRVSGKCATRQLRSGSYTMCAGCRLLRHSEYASSFVLANLFFSIAPKTPKFSRIHLRFDILKSVLLTCFTFMLWNVAPKAALAHDIEGISEPVYHAEVASPEAGTVEEVFVRQGQVVRKGDELIQMDSEILLPTLELARAKSEVRAKLEAAKIEVQVKQRRLESLTRLGKENSSSEELIRATADVELAQTQVIAAEEEIRQNQLEAKRIEVQLARRTIRSPINGIVTKIHYDIGEFVTTAEPHVVTVVDLSKLRLVFFVPSLVAEDLSDASGASVRMERQKEPVSTTVDYVSPVTSADSGTVRIELILDNKDGRHRSGLRCWLSDAVTDGISYPRSESAQLTPDRTERR